ncbi:hypothetical protein O1M54_26095 [Streptomyces diastatochromogenes]|nr:hypothetical protein [Streptomyces diastatochromogenes]
MGAAALSTGAHMVGRIRRWHQRHWHERSKAERVELQSVVTWHGSIWVLPIGWLMLPLVSGLDHRPLPMALGGLLIAVDLLQCAAASRVLRPALDVYLGRAELPPRAQRGPAVLLGLALGRSWRSPRSTEPTRSPPGSRSERCSCRSGCRTRSPCPWACSCAAPRTSRC